MPNYDFLNLAPREFEELSRDLLQKHLGLFFESFGDGRDSGIDLQHAETRDARVIVQAKRRKDFRSLLRDLRGEVPKVRALAPERYIVTTSATLTPKNKDDISQLFEPFVQSSQDIYGRDDLNNLLNVFPEIEQANIKLWLSSENILRRILHSGIHSQSYLEREEIEETVATYVVNPSFDLALQHIQDQRCVIISGIPGIGKTTLARMLVYYFLRKGFDDFVFLSSSVDEAFDVLNQKKKQIFLFDDFLGRSFNRTALKTNEDRNILKLMRLVSKSDNKILIMTTREYILAQAKQVYEGFNEKSVDLAKCVIELSQYTRLIRAQILYNHLFFSEIPNDYLRPFITTQGYLRVISHENYNPRTIETLVHKGVWKEIKPNEFTDKFLEFLNNPEGVWKHAYESQISEFSKLLLANVLISGVPILIDDLSKAMESFVQKCGANYGVTFSEFEFNKAIRELENTFITLVKDGNGKTAVDYQNPAIQDFLVHLLSTMPRVLEHLISGAIFQNQLLELFDFSGSKPDGRSRLTRIPLSQPLIADVVNRLKTDFKTLDSSEVSRLTSKGDSSGQFAWYRNPSWESDRLYAIAIRTDLLKRPEVSAFILEQLDALCRSRRISFGYKSLHLVERFYKSLNADFGPLFERWWDNLFWLSHISDFRRLEKVSPVAFREIAEDRNRFETKINDLAYEEVENADEDELTEILETLESIELFEDIDLSEYKARVEERLAERAANQDTEFDWKDGLDRRTDEDMADVDKDIKELFRRFDGR
jgi:hypothetical protein